MLHGQSGIHSTEATGKCQEQLQHERGPPVAAATTCATPATIFTSTSPATTTKSRIATSKAATRPCEESIAH
eukprot:CAMPEP_0177607014 /NCGR_PEP_ID=MMETSP0419_2-20121207/17661_1 /TAXON_ID=582737 /ORGANISM="Tetraselmis sp., Strain GSL018" /LENGTH=71 /DNA_ID=CAMNT_0019101507 /DNA_START=936 /DNA_END=1151 /DNA_ORIENTATION=-